MGHIFANLNKIAFHNSLIAFSLWFVFYSPPKNYNYDDLFINIIFVVQLSNLICFPQSSYAACRENQIDSYSQVLIKSPCKCILYASVYYSTKVVIENN